MTQVDAARTYRVSLRAISRWMKHSREGGLRALRAGKRGRRPGSGHLSHTQAVRIRKLLIERMPDQLALPFYLWTREAVAQLIGREYGIRVSKWTAGRYLKAWGMSAQKPVRRAYERIRCGDRAMAEGGLSADRERGEAGKGAGKDACAGGATSRTARTSH
ncbi:hypothetical protein G3A41_37675 [Paraburkholderia aspalathi]|uniref:winged helix-turn-helix domain-containing protein n=1 Tax=Paraburkholderia aspalathi TaxID=1324617 RepID=UPI00190A767E|nr:hypothetical protein [Paraburkholderia aspalathi]MBK3835772.1 hypothetical protein [Paraburkholderia aspalathi]MBK3865553.1 hypothetical protein [Paraburkholderia aspalathi]